MASFKRAIGIETTISCETLPMHAKVIDKVTLIRSMGHDNSDQQHGMHWCQTGHDAKANDVNPFKGSSHPSIGLKTGLVRGSNHRAMPSYVHVGYPLVEAGATFVTVVDPGIGLSGSGWDLHRQLEPGMNKAWPRTDRVVTTLIEDLHDRGPDKKVLLVVWGEFGRTPRINKDAGRDHGEDLQSVLVSGGGFRTGQVIGSSTSKGEIPKDRRLWPYDMLATMYHHLGIDVHREFHNLAGRPIPILARGTPIRELL